MLIEPRRIRQLLTALVIAGPVVRYLSHDLPLFFIANADMLAVPAIGESVQRNGLSALSDWYWPPAPYVLTDVIPYGAIWAVVPSVWLAPAVFMIGQLFALYLAIRWLGRTLVPDVEVADWGALASFSTIVVFASALVDPARFVLVSYYRAGSFILGLLALGLLASWIEQGRPDARWRTVGVVGIATALAIASDPLMVPAVAGPLVVVLVALALVPSERGGWRDARRLVSRHCIAVVAGTVAGLTLNDLVATDESTYGPSLTGGRMREQAQMITELFSGSNLPLRAFGVVGVLTAVRVLARRPRGTVTPVHGVGAFWLVSTGAHLVAMLLDTSDPALRYVQVVALLPIAWLGPLVASQLGAPTWRAGRWAPQMLAVTAAAAAIVPALPEIDEIDLAYQAPEAACLDSLVPRDGVGVSGYWEARLIQLHSRYERDLAPLDGAGDPLRINASSDWFDQPYDFAVVGTQTPGWDLPLTLMEALAPDATSSECSTLVILDAGEGGLRLDRLFQPGGQVAFDGCDLGTVVGVVDEASCTIVVPTGSSGFASFGGYVGLEPGRYDITVTFSSDALAETRLGTAEVTRVRTYGGDVEVVLAAPLFGPPEKAQGSLTLTVDVPSDNEGFIVELRTITDGVHSFTVEGVTIAHR